MQQFVKCTNQEVSQWHWEDKVEHSFRTQRTKLGPAYMGKLSWANSRCEFKLDQVNHITFQSELEETELKPPSNQNENVTTVR